LFYWGWHSKNTGIFTTGGAIIVALGIIIFVSGITTSNLSSMATTKSIIDGNTVYTTATTFQTISTSNDGGFWIIPFCLMVVGGIGTLVGFSLMTKKK
jgi:hypothetical protein